VVVDEGWDLLGFAQKASDLAAGNLEFVTIPTEGGENNSRGNVVVVDEGVVRDFVERRIEEQEAAAELAADTEPPAPAPPPPPPPDVDESRYVVDVRNASGASGLAAQVSDQLREAGFVRGSVDNAAASPTSVIRYSGSDGDAARAVASRLGGIAVEAGETTPGHLLVMLGADFGPAAVASSAPSAVPIPADGTITAAGVPCID
jgi:hypothetical protein